MAAVAQSNVIDCLLGVGVKCNGLHTKDDSFCTNGSSIVSNKVSDSSSSTRSTSKPDKSTSGEVDVSSPSCLPLSSSSESVSRSSSLPERKKAS